jgi:DNA-binding IscR family transcriptional regulator
MPSKKQPASALSAKRAERKQGPSTKRTAQTTTATTKKQQLIDLLSGAKPVATEKVSKTLEWQPHTVRAAIAGLRKAGFVVDSTKGPDGGGTCYRIVSHPQSTGAVA